MMAAIALGGGGLAHPQFFLIGALVFAGVAAWSLARRERGWRSDAGRVALATIGGGAILAGGLLAMTIGPARLAVDTSKDGFLRRAGMSDAVRHAYLERALHRWTRYVQWLALPLGGAGVDADERLRPSRARGLDGARDRRGARRFAHRMVPRRSIDHVRVLDPGARGRRRGRRVALARTPDVAGHDSAPRCSSASWRPARSSSWSRQQPFIAPLEVDRATTAARIADTLPTGTPLVFVVDDDDATVSFLATRAANVIRASMPPGPGRRRLHLRGNGRELPARRAHRPRERRVRRDVSPLPARHPAGSRPGRVRPGAVQPNAGRHVRSRAHPLGTGGVFDACPARPASAAPDDPLEPSSPAQIVLTAFLLLALTGAVGLGWARWAGLDAPASAAVAPAIGVATLAVVGVALEPLGLPLSGSVGPTIVALLAGGAGYVLLVLQGKASAPPSPSVEEQPAE